MTLAEALLDDGPIHPKCSDSSPEPLFRFLTSSGALTLTRQQLRRKAASLGTTLRREGLSGQPVLLLHPAGLDGVVALWACLLAGSIAVPASPPDIRRLASTGQRVRDIASDAEVRAVLAPPKLRHVLEPALGLDARWISEGGEGGEDSFLTAPPSPDAPALLQYTSGSTGRPRGAVLLHRNLVSNSEAIRTAFDLGPESRAVTWLPPHHDMGLIGCLIQPVYSGVQITLMSPDDFVRDPMRWLREMSTNRATHGVAPDFAYALCARRARSADLESLDLSHWRVAINGAEPVDYRTLGYFAKVFHQAGFDASAFAACYGLAEATLLVTVGALDRKPTLLPVDAPTLRRGSITPGDDTVLVGCGTPVADTELVIVAEGQRTAEGSVGDILIRGPGVGIGYQPPQSEDRAFFTEFEGEAWLRTRDRGLLLDGELYLVGRSDDCMVVSGQNYYAHDVERIVADSSAEVRTGCVAAFGVDSNGDTGIAVVAELRGDRQVVPRGVRTAISRGLADQLGLRLARLEFVEAQALPRTTSGKLRRFEARNRLADGHFDLLAAAPVIRREEGLSGHEARAWETVHSALAAIRADHAEWPEDQPLQELGLTSLAISELLARVEDQLRVGLRPGPYSLITTKSLVAELTERLETSEGADSPEVEANDAA